MCFLAGYYRALPFVIAGSKPGTSPIFNLVPSAPTRKLATDDFLNADSDKNDYDWYARRMF